MNAEIHAAWIELTKLANSIDTGDSDTTPVMVLATLTKINAQSARITALMIDAFPMGAQNNDRA